MRETNGGVTDWDLLEAGPADAEQTVLLLPGGLCSGVFFEELFSEPKLVEARVRLVAATVPGFGRTPPPADLGMDNYARLAGDLASKLDADVVVGHSMGGNVAIEMVGTGDFSGPVVLLAPTFSAADEFNPLRVLDRVARVPGVGHLAWTAMLKLMPKSMKDEFPADRADKLVADLANNDPGVCRRMVRRYFEYLEHHGEVATRLCDSGVPAWVVRGGRDDIGLTDEERRILDACPKVTMVDVADAGHMLVQDQPALVADLILQAIDRSHDSLIRSS